MKPIHGLLGVEHDLDEVSRRLYDFARRQGAPAFGALQLTCSDESELECVDAFRRSFAEHLLPNLKFGERSSFRLANLGARYEWGAAGIAEGHYATKPSSKGFKVIVVKINSHVSVERGSEGLRFGNMARYDEESAYCGALHTLLAGSRLPFATDLGELFASEGVDRLATLRDEDSVEPLHRILFAAVANARLQARLAAAEIRDRRPRTPTLFVVLACVTLNRKQKDGEIVCGVYRADWRGEEPVVEYRGLSDNPAAYRLAGSAPLRIEDDEIGSSRSARDHRAAILELWRQTGGAPPGESDNALRRPAVESVAGNSGSALERRLVELAREEPVPAAIRAFGRGLAGIHHLLRAHRLARGLAGETAARRILADLRAEAAGFPPDRARRALELMG